MLILLLFLALVISTFAIHCATRAIIGAAADILPGGALIMMVFVFMAFPIPAPAWLVLPVCLLGAAAGHVLSVWCWRSKAAPSA